jgi:aspartate 1-decarboxylase
MLISIMRSKIHRATVTETHLEYEGSITIDEKLLEESGLYKHEKVQVVNLNNGSRLETYIIKGKKNSGIICLNGPAARKALPGDKVIIISYALIDEKQANSFKSVIIKVDDNNKITEIKK